MCDFVFSFKLFPSYLSSVFMHLKFLNSLISALPFEIYASQRYFLLAKLLHIHSLLFTDTNDIKLKIARVETCICESYNAEHGKNTVRHDYLQYLSLLPPPFFLPSCLPSILSASLHLVINPCNTLLLFCLMKVNLVHNVLV